MLMVGRRPSIALEDLKRYWGRVEFSPGFTVPRAERYDLVIAQEPTLRIGLPALIQAKLSGATFVCEVHGDYLRSGFLPVKDLLAAKVVLPSADHIRAVNAGIAESLKSWRVRNVMVIPSVYVRTDLFRSTTSHKTRRNVVLAASRLVPEKGLDLLLRSIPRIIERVRDLEVRIVGEGPERPKLERTVRELRLTDVVRFTGWVRQEELVRHYNEAAVFVCTSFHEGGPRTVFEAAACQTPFVSTAVGLIPEVFSNGREGYIIQERDSELLASKIEELLENPELRQEMGARGREVVERHFEWRKAVERYARAYLDLVRGP